MSLQDKMYQPLECENRLLRLRIENLEKDNRQLEKDRNEDISIIAKQNNALDAAHQLISMLEQIVADLRAEKMVKEIIQS